MCRTSEIGGETGLLAAGRGVHAMRAVRQRLWCALIDPSLPSVRTRGLRSVLKPPPAGAEARTRLAQSRVRRMLLRPHLSCRRRYRHYRLLFGRQWAVTSCTVVSLLRVHCHFTFI